MLPDGPPVLGASGLPGIWLNLGHGSSGWALSCGSARIVADAMAGGPRRSIPKGSVWNDCAAK
jgi:D-amino-acid dehydrogenase